MRAFRWGLAVTFLGLALSVDLSGWDKAWLLVAAGLAAFGYDIAHSAEARFTAKYRGWKERRERQRHTQVVTSLQQIIEKLNRDAEADVARAGTDEAKAKRLSEWREVHAVLLEVMRSYEKAMEYGTIAADTIKDIDSILAGNAAKANEVEGILGLPLTVDREYEAKMSPEQKVEQIRQRSSRYHKERMDKVTKDALLFPGA